MEYLSIVFFPDIICLLEALVVTLRGTLFIKAPYNLTKQHVEEALRSTNCFSDLSSSALFISLPFVVFFLVLSHLVCFILYQ